MPKKYRIFGTTADFGVVSTGRDAKEAFANQAMGMFSSMVNLNSVRPTDTFAVEATGHDLTGLLAGFLEELLFIFDAKGVLLREFTITRLTDTDIVAEAKGEEIDLTRHLIRTPIKAVTHHMLLVEETAYGVRTRVVYDI